MSDLKQVKVDNWGIYFLQRLKHFFNRTDYCDLTLQFQDNAQLKVHRLVLSACTEYFEVLERTCEMYEDCLVMPDDLQADVVVPIINFMYTGQLEFKPDLLEKLHLTSLIMNMPVLTKLLDAQKLQLAMKNNAPPTFSYGKQYPKLANKPKRANDTAPVASSSRSVGMKRSYNKSFDAATVSVDKRLYQPPIKIERAVTNNGNATIYGSTSPSPLEAAVSARKVCLGEPRPTRYELPEELENDNIYSNSFTSISYTSDPFMVHPETTKKYSKKSDKTSFANNSGSRGMGLKATLDIVNCKQSRDTWVESEMEDTDDVFRISTRGPREVASDASHLFDQILDHGPKVTIETKPGKQSSNIDHAKIISEVLKKYPHLVKNNKNIKLKILDSSTKTKRPNLSMANLTKTKKQSEHITDCTYESEVLDSKEAATLIAMGAENIKGPWICLICGTPGRAIHFQSYYKFRRHLVEVHNEKPVSNICEYCGLKSNKRNYLLHHMYTKHRVPPPPQYKFPKCKSCNYIALTEGLLNKHKASHMESSSFRCNVCSKMFDDSNTLLLHIQTTGHKYTAEKKNNIQCIYCMKLFTRESTLYTHLKTHHKIEAKDDGVIEDSDEDMSKDTKTKFIKTELKTEFGYESENEPINIQYQIEQRPDGQVHLVTTKRTNVGTPMKQKILNPGFGDTLPKSPQKSNTIINPSSSYMESSPECLEEDNNEEIIIIGETEYVMKGNQLIPRKQNHSSQQFIISDINVDEHVSNNVQDLASDTLEYTNLSNIVQNPDKSQQTKVAIKKEQTNNQSIQFLEYKTLMPSNPSIIFDEGNTSKTLTVIATPNSSTTLDLQGSQTNDMVILPDYPLEVAESVPSDTSNIVVVYSHPVDEQDKSYQLQTQYVQASGTDTQIYETITSSTPVITTAVNNLNEPVWQTAITSPTTTQATDHIIQETGTMQANVQEHIEIHMNELPEVHVTSQDCTKAVVSDVATETVREEPDLNEEVDGIMTANIEDKSNDNEKECNPEAIVVIESAEVNENEEHKNVLLTETNDEASLVIIQDQLVEVNESEGAVINHIECISEDHEEAGDKIQSTEDTEQLPIDKNAEKNLKPPSIPLPCNERTVKNGDKAKFEVPVHKVPVANLAMEWSEDEDLEAEEQNIPVKSFNKDECVVEKKIDDDGSTEVEESIENIQHEMEKQVNEQEKVIIESEQENADLEAKTALEKVSQDNIPNNSEQKAVGPTEKISSLLNDWDENDSQEGSTNEHATADENNETDDKSAPKLLQDVVLDPKSNIKSLVKDWDDDEEENKHKEKN